MLTKYSETRLQNHFPVNKLTVKNTVARMGAVQAQDFNMAKWAVALRMPGYNNAQVEAAVNNADILRLHILRPTWHFVSCDDIYWMLQLSAPRVKMQLKSSDKLLELDSKVLAKAFKEIEKALEGHNYLTRSEIGEILIDKKINSDTRRLNHIMYHAELCGIVCSGTVRARQQTYGLLEERVPLRIELGEEESLKTLAKRYFGSHAPASIADFIWWSGLTTAQAKKAVNMILESGFETKTIDGTDYIFTKIIDAGIKNDKVYLLPAFDEYIVAYRNRDIILPAQYYKKIITSNGIFKPAIIINGTVKGLWSMVKIKNKITAKTELFEKLDKAAETILHEKIDAYEKYNSSI